MGNLNYAQIDADGRVCGISMLAGDVIAPNMIPIATYDPLLIGKYWDADQLKFVYAPGMNDVDAARAARLAAIRYDAYEVITKKYPLWLQSNVSLGLYPETVMTEMKAAITAVITESNRCEDLVGAASTIEEINVVTPNWPTL